MEVAMSGIAAQDDKLTSLLARCAAAAEDSVGRGGAILLLPGVGAGAVVPCREDDAPSFVAAVEAVVRRPGRAVGRPPEDRESVVRRVLRQLEPWLAGDQAEFDPYDVEPGDEDIPF
jgi:hypothetical protein